MIRNQLHAVQRHQQTMAPRLQQAVRLLQLSSQDFVLQLHETMGRNPFLEGEDDDGAAVEPQADTRQEAEPSALDRPEPSSDWGGAPGSAARAGHGQATGDAHDWIAASATLAEHLHTQLNVLRLSWRDLALARALVESLDDDGYLRSGLEESTATLAIEPPADVDELQIALRRVQALEPSGVAARSVAECLQLQLRQGTDASSPIELLAERIVAEHLPLLAGRHLDKLARALGTDEACIALACERIRALDPRPGWRFGASDTQYILPDIVVRKRAGIWVAALNPQVVPKVRLNETYADLFTRHRVQGGGAMAAQLQEARWTVNNVQQRFATILSVAQAIIDRQGLFFDYGPMAMKPMQLREIADEVGAHPSTVCRVTNNKYMATPAGTFELKYFFSRALPSTSGGSFSPTAVKSLIGDMIAAEDPQRPLSDAQIARDLVTQGLPIVRRTVTKYRQNMQIDVAGSRRRDA